MYCVMMPEGSQCSGGCWRGGWGKDTEPPGPDKGQRAPLDGLNDGSSLSHSWRVGPPARVRASRVAWCRSGCETPGNRADLSARPSSFLPPSPDLTSPPLPSHWSRGCLSQDGVPFPHKTLSLGGKEGPCPVSSGFIGLWVRMEELHAKAGGKAATLRRGPESPWPLLVAHNSGSPSASLQRSTTCLMVQGLPVMGDVCIVTPVPPALGDGPSFTFQLLWPPVIMYNPDLELMPRVWS